MNVPALIFWLVVVCSFWARPGTVLVLLLASIPFASLSLLPPEITGGMTLLPQMMFAVVLILKVVGPHVVTLSPQFISALQLRNLGYLALFLLVGILVTLIMPRLFGGIVIMPMRASWMGDLLSPISGEFHAIGLCDTLRFDCFGRDVDGGSSEVYRHVAGGIPRRRLSLRRHWPD